MFRMTALALVCASLFTQSLLAQPCSGDLAPGEVVLEETFDSYATDAAALAAGWRIVDVADPVENATWTLTNPGRRANPATCDGSASSGRFMISDSDFASGSNPTGTGMSHDLWSPRIDCSALDRVWLHMDVSAQLNNNGEAVFDVDVSTADDPSEDSESWVTVFRRVAPSRVGSAPRVSVDNADGFFGRLHVDLTAQAAQRGTVRFRVRHFEPNDDWWIAIDNVLVDDVPPPLGGRVTLLAIEDFSAGIPESWTLRGDNSGDNTWNTSDPCGRSVARTGAAFPHQDGRGLHRLGEHFAILDSDCDPDPAEDEFLITPSVDCSGMARVYLHFRSEVLSSGGTEEVLVSLDGGASFLTEPLFSYKGGGLVDSSEEPFYAERVFSVPAAVGRPDVAFAFRYRGQNDWWWALTDVSVTSTPRVGGLPPRASFTTDRSSGFAPLEVTFDASASFDAEGGSLTYDWDFGDGVSGTGARVVHRFEGPGAFTVTLTVTDEDDLSDTATAAINVLVPGALVKKVLIIGIDGCRPDALQAANTPILDSLIDDGAVSYEAQTGDITSSGPGWSSMLTGVWRNKHNVSSNSFSNPNYDEFPHFFRRVKEQFPDKFTASIVNWSPINEHIVSDSDHTVSRLNDAGVSRAVSDLIADGDPDAIFIHFDEVDGAGHGCCYSPTNADYLAEIEEKDRQTGPILDAIRSRPTFEQEDWLVLVGTDHGGRGTGHGGNTPEERTIFLILSGPSACRGQIEPAPGIVSVATTAMAHLGVVIDPAWDLDGRALGSSDCVRGTCPEDLTCVLDADSSAVDLSWKAASELEVTGYEVLLHGVTVASLPAGSTSFRHEPELPATPSEVLLRYELVALGGEDVERCRPLTCQVSFSTGEVCFADDFEDYSSDAQVVAAGWRLVDVNDPVEESTWTVTNPGARANPPTVDGSRSGGRFMISDSDAQAGSNPPGSGMSHDLWSPVFSCVGMDRVFLHMDCCAQLNNNGDAVFDVDVSSDGGTSWTNVFRRVTPERSAPPFATNENADGFFGRLDLDISSVANRESVRFRLRHFEPSFDWWIAIDNVVVDDVAVSRGGDVVLLEVETFSAGIPASWTVRSLAGNRGTETWHTTDKGGRYTRGDVSERGVNRLNHPRAAPEFAIVDSDADPDPAEDEFLITPAVDCTGYERVFLHYASELILSATEEVLVSFDGGATFEPRPIFSYAGGGLREPGEEPSFARRVLEVPSAVGRSRVAFAFHYEGQNDWWWAVDDVAITATSPAGGNQPPLASFTVDRARGRAPLTVRFDGSGSTDADGAITSFEWTFGDGGAATGETVEHTFEEEGSYTVELSVTDDDGASQSAERVIDVDPPVSGGLQLPGDCNQDGRLDVSDAVCLLDALFLGAGPVEFACGDRTLLDPANVVILDFNGDARLDLSDAVATLRFLFLGGPPHPLGQECRLMEPCEANENCDR